MNGKERESGQGCEEMRGTDKNQRRDGMEGEETKEAGEGEVENLMDGGAW